MVSQALKISSLLLLCLVSLAYAQDDRQPSFSSAPVAAAPFAAPPPPKSSCTGGFSVRKAESRTRAGQRLRFQDIITNMGGWSSSAGDFQAPCSGVYFFTFHAVSTQQGDFTVALMKNGEYQVTAYGTKDDYQQGSNSALLVLNKGDSVYLELQQGEIYEHPFNEAYTTFTGFLVEPF